MESDATPQQALAQAERATAAVWYDYPPTPWWYCPGAGAWHAAFPLAIGGLRDAPALLLVALAALMAVAAGFTTWYTRYRGAMPRVGGAIPAEFRPAVVAFGGGYLTLLVGVAIVFVTAGYGAAAIVALVGVTAGFAVYERAYAAAAAATRARVG
ncbi:MAG TPA: hypothetical protein VIL48_11030 [Acidimicrobiales bacterium]